MTRRLHSLICLFLTLGDGLADHYDIEAIDWSELHLVGDFKSQAELVLRRVRMPRSEVLRIQDVMDSLNEQLRKLSSDYKITPFGSIPNGLALFSSDIDLYVAYPEDIRKTPGNIVLTLGEELKKQNIYSDIKTLNYHIPLLRFVHTPTKQKVDVTFSHFDKEKEKETHLIKYLFRTNEKALSLMILVKYWSNIHKLVLPFTMPNIIWYIMVTFYLQQIDIFPSIHQLQKPMGPEIDKIWNVAFQESYSYFYLPDNDDSLYKLLGGFFKYYSEFDFETNVISTFFGTALSRDLFKNISDVPGVFKLYKYNVKNNLSQPLNISTPFCIQRPFDHSLNFAFGVSSNIAIRIVRNIHEAARLYDETSETSFLQAILTINKSELESS